MNKKNKDDRLKTSMTVDALGLYCPMPIVKLKVGLHEIGKNEILEILADDPGFEEDVKQWCSNTGNTLLHIDKNGDIIKVFVKNTA